MAVYDEYYMLLIAWTVVTLICEWKGVSYLDQKMF